MKIKLSDKGSNFFVNAKKVGPLGKFIGLMFKSNKTECLLFDFSKPVSISIHSCFVFFPFLAVWIDGKYSVLEKRVIYPWKFSVRPKSKFNMLVEIPFNEKNRKVIKSLMK